MTDDALLMMPQTLRMLLERHRGELRRGALEPLTSEGSAPHVAPWLGGSLIEEIERRSDLVIESVRAQKPFREVAARFGALAHFVADAGFPPAAGAAEGVDHLDHFAALVEERREKFPFVFYGHGETALDRGDLPGSVAAILERARSQNRDLLRAYREAGDVPAEWAFDDRSVPFAIASLSYSRTTTDIVRIWLETWKRAGGDLGRTPYLQRSREERRSE